MTPTGGCARNSAASSAAAPARQCQRWRPSCRPVVVSPAKSGTQSASAGAGRLGPHFALMTMNAGMTTNAWSEPNASEPLPSPVHSEIGDRAAAALGAHVLAERRGLARVGEAAGAQPPEVWPSCSILLIAGWRLSNRSGMRLLRRCHSIFAAASDDRAASCTRLPWPARRCVPAPASALPRRHVFRHGGGCRVRAGGLVGATGVAEPAAGATIGATVQPGPVVRRRLGRRRGTQAPGVRAPRAAAPACRCWCRPSPDRMSSFAPATCMPPGLSGFTRIGGYRPPSPARAPLRWPISDQPPTTSSKAPPSPPAIERQPPRAGVHPARRCRGTR